MMRAAVPFVHFDLVVKVGDEFPDDHPMVVARPDLFTVSPAAKRRKTKES